MVSGCGAGLAQAVALVQAEGPLQQVGLVLGTAVTATLLVRSGKRVAATPDDPSGAGLHPPRPSRTQPPPIPVTVVDANKFTAMANACPPMRAAQLQLPTATIVCTSPQRTDDFDEDLLRCSI